MSLANHLICKGQVYSLSEDIEVPFAISGETLDLAEFTIVVLEDEFGRKGIGEGSPFSTLTGDNIHGVFHTAQEIVNGIKGLSPVMGLRLLRENREEFFATSPSAFVAVETALWDLLGKQVSLPLSALWGQRMKDSVSTDITLPIMPSDVVPDFWAKFSGHQFSVIKIKVSGNLSEDLDRIFSLLKLVPSHAQFTLDGNKGYDLEGALKLLETLKDKGCQPIFFEQPLPADDWDGLNRVERLSGIPVCLDESVVSPEDAIRVVRDRVASMINLKIMKSGIEETRQIISIAKAAGISLMIGGMLESEIAMTASLQLACGAGWISHFDLDTPFFFKRLVSEKSPWHSKSAKLHCPMRPGLGIELRSDLLPKL